MVERYLKEFQIPLRRPTLQTKLGTARANSVIAEAVRAGWIASDKGLFKLTPAGEVQLDHYLGVKK